VRASAPAKINLGLVVGPLRDDGKHELLTVYQRVGLADRIDVDAAGGLRVEGFPGDTLVRGALEQLAAASHVEPAWHVRIEKRIPVAAGLGGGSADAAAALRALVDLWRVALPIEELFDMAARLGADVPMCLAGRAALASGVGERLATAPALPACAILLVNPGVALATPAVFAARRGDFSPERPLARPWTDLAGFARTLAERGNDLTDAAVSLQPVVGEVLAFLRRTDGAVHVAMSGSGATCFALYATIDEAQRAAARVPAPWWRHAGMLIG
jgi:4-diphosphocytidyl-2-C-methyl-D-erythritol kinase